MTSIDFGKVQSSGWYFGHFGCMCVSATVDVTAEGIPGNYTVNSEGILREV